MPSGPSASVVPGTGTAVRVAATIRTAIPLAEPGSLGCRQTPGEAGEQCERGHQSTPELAPRAEQCSGDAAAVNTPVVLVASHAVGQWRAGHAGAPLPRPALSGNATASGPRQPRSNTGSSRTARISPENG